MAGKEGIYTLCKARYADLESPKYGSIDGGVFHPETRALLLYSVIYHQGQLVEVHLFPCFSGDFPPFDIPDSEAMNNLFKDKAVRTGESYLEILCAENMPFRAILSSIHEDVRVLPLDKRHVFLDNVEACFPRR